MEKAAKDLLEHKLEAAKRGISKSALFYFLQKNGTQFRYKNKASMFIELIFCEYELISHQANHLHNMGKHREAIVMYDKAKKIYKNYNALLELIL